MFELLEKDRENFYVNGPYMVVIDECDQCENKGITLVLQDYIEFKINDTESVTRRIRFCVKCMRSMIL